MQANKIINKSIIQSLQNKDKKAITTIYNEYGAALYGVILRIVKSEQMAQTVLQEAFVEIWKHADQYDATREKLFTWLYRISRQLAIEAIQVKKSAPAEIYTFSKRKTPLNAISLLNSRLS